MYVVPPTFICTLNLELAKTPLKTNVAWEFSTNVGSANVATTHLSFVMIDVSCTVKILRLSLSPCRYVLPASGT